MHFSLQAMIIREIQIILEKWTEKRKSRERVNSLYPQVLIYFFLITHFSEQITESHIVIRNNTETLYPPMVSSNGDILQKLSYGVTYRILTLIESTYRRVTTPQGSLLLLLYNHAYLSPPFILSRIIHRCILPQFFL